MFDCGQVERASHNAEYQGSVARNPGGTRISMGGGIRRVHIELAVAKTRSIGDAVNFEGMKDPGLAASRGRAGLRCVS